MTNYHNDELNLFQQEDEFGNVFKTDQLEVVKSEFVQKENLTWNELFEGFDELYRIFTKWFIASKIFMKGTYTHANWFRNHSSSKIEEYSHW